MLWQQFGFANHLALIKWVQREMHPNNTRLRHYTNFPIQVKSVFVLVRADLVLSPPSGEEPQNHTDTTSDAETCIVHKAEKPDHILFQFLLARIDLLHP